MQEKSQIFRYFISIAIKEAAIGRHGHPAKTKKRHPIGCLLVSSQGLEPWTH